MGWAQTEDSEVSGHKGRFRVISSSNDGYHNAGTIGRIAYGIVCICKLCNLGANSTRRGIFLDVVRCITGDLRNGSGKQWGVRWVEDTLDILADEQWFTTLDLVSRYWQVS